MTDTEKIKVFNPQKFDVGVVTQDVPLGFNVKHDGFALLTKDEISYLNSTCSLFTRGILRVDEEHRPLMEAVGIDQADNANFITDTEIEKKLSGSAKKIEEWLEPITEQYVLDKICEIAKGMNLNLSKIKVLQEKMPNKDFINE